jgi:ATP-dependent Lon protease
MPRITKNTPSKSLGFKGDFFSEVLHELRSDLQYADFVTRSLRLPQCEDMRDNKAIARLAEGYLKLLFPDLNVTTEDFIEYCVNPAVRMRQQVRDELAKLDQEYAWTTILSETPDDFQLSHPEEKPMPDEEQVSIDPLDPHRKPVATTIDIHEGQRGISYEKLFAPYLREATRIKLVDPYIRYDYQIHNLMNFCECLGAGPGEIELELRTSGDSMEQEVELSAKLDELGESLSRDHIKFTYDFESKLHDRSIDTDNGWRIILGRGLDIFQKPEGRFTLGFVDQTKRQCKATTISITQVAE